MLGDSADLEACFTTKLHKKIMPTKWLEHDQDIKPCMTNQLFGEKNSNKGIKTLFLEAIKTSAFNFIKKPDY